MPAPEFKDLVTFPDAIELSAQGNAFESEPFTSGALVRSKVDGNVVMLFDAGPVWALVASGGQTQSFSQPFAQDQEGSITMPWRLRTASKDSKFVSIRVDVSMEGEDTKRSKEKDIKVTYKLNLMERVLLGLRRMLGMEKTP
jgi:hypothetical protein